MRGRAWATAWIVAAVLGGGARGEQAPASDELTALRRVNEAFTAAINAQDASKVGDLYTADALLMPPNESPVRGRAAVVAYFGGLLKSGKVGLQTRSGTAHRDGSLGYDAGEFTFELVPAGGQPVRDTGKYLVVLRKEVDGRWRIAVDTWNSDLATR